MKVQTVVFCVLTPNSNVVGYQHFRWPCCLYLQGEVNSSMKGALIWGGSIRGLESVQANTAGRTGQVKSPFLTYMDGIRRCSLQGPTRWTLVHRAWTICDQNHLPGELEFQCRMFKQNNYNDRSCRLLIQLIGKTSVVFLYFDPPSTALARHCLNTSEM
jgi:hypothetical protein